MTRIVNGEELHQVSAYRMGDYLITQGDGGPWHVAHVTRSDGPDLALSTVGSWYELPDAVQGARHHAGQHKHGN